jgi:hypothetical protein
MNASNIHLDPPRAEPLLHEPDIAREIATVLQALIMVVAILLGTLLAAGAIEPAAAWLHLNLTAWPVS